METKKSKKANLERFRVVLFQTGLVVSLLFAIILLSWNFKVVVPDEPDQWKWDPIEIDPTLPPVIIKKPDAPKPTEPPKQKPENNIKIIDDAIKSDSPEKPITPDSPEITNIPKTLETPTGEIDPRVSADRMPASPACTHINENINRIKCTEEFIINKVYNYLKDKNSRKISGKVYVYFVINRYGKIDDVKIMSGIEPSLDKEVVNAVYSLGEFEPAIHEGLPVSIKFTLPISFKIN